ncbi:efflux RND transporter permease subunit [Sphingomonas sp.]|jgi:multidrug efflux pump subunit AcrB|uniref:efflux RND transporter permease subunit n=1 Tax=Sphingomonas sp. TaxID=28214 RepID=UPI002D7F7295|nr:efflux RND transporter permease subunit [Sphingomonas sp.]HEU0043996.1 efflux RND transporter permease subunit [Sphingomonas sp.]
MGFRNMSAWAIRNPVVPIVLFLALTVAGIISFMRLDVNQDPDIDFPVAYVSISQPGASPSELETQVTKRIEAAARNIQGVDELRSQVREGSTSTSIQLKIGANIDRAVADLRDAVTQVRSQLPDGILEPQIGRVDTTENEIANFTAITTDMTVEQLSWYIDDTVTKELLSIPGMGGVERSGGVNREIRVILDPVKLQALGLTAPQINAQLRQTNLNATGGRARIAGAEQSVRVLGNADDVFTLSNTLVNVGPGRTVRLRDIAEVRDSFADQRSRAAVDGKQVVSFDFKRSKGASDVTVFKEAEKALAKLEERNPKVRFQLLSTSVKDTEIAYHGAIEAMIEGSVLAVLVVFLFLRDWRATAISALAIPLSAIPTFFFMELLGFSLNQMTLLALSLVAGVLVDDAIVEIENIVRHMKMGKSAYQASIDAADEIGLAVLATTMSIVAVFMPVSVMPGISGQFFKNFGLTVVAAVLMSLAVARLITPMVAAYFLKAGGHAEPVDGPIMRFYMRCLRWTVDISRFRAAKASAKSWIGRRLARFLDHRVWVMGIAFLALAATVAIFMILPQQFQPPMDKDRSVVTVTMPPGSTLEQTDVVVGRVAALLAQQKEIVTSVYQRAFTGSGRVTATLAEDRKMTSVEFERSVAPLLAAIPDARVSFQNTSGWGGPSRDLSIVLGGDDPLQLQNTADKIVAEMQALRSLQSPRTEGGLQRPEIVIRPRMDLAADLGITTSALSNAIRVATIGEVDQNSARYSLSDRQIPIRVGFAQSAGERLSNIENLAVPTQNGGSVPLKVVADIGFGAGATQIDRISQQRQLTIGADLAPGVIEGEAMKQIEKLPTMANLPIGVSRLTVGQSKAQAELVTNIIVAVFAGFFLLFAVLVLLYRRFLPPFVNLGSLFLAPLGACIALWIAGMPVSLPVYIGLLMLLGIVAKNSILLVDFALEEMSKGVRRFDAILDAGHKRAQPIVMTTVAMVAGMIPTALSLTGDGSFRAPMSVTVMGGLILSTVLTLLIVPSSFSLALGVERAIGAKLGRRLLTYRPGDDGLPVIDGGPPRPALGATSGRLGFDPDAPRPAE